MRIERAASVAGQGTFGYQPRGYTSNQQSRNEGNEDESGEFREHLKRMRKAIDVSRVRVKDGVMTYDAWR